MHQQALKPKSTSCARKEFGSILDICANNFQNPGMKKVESLILKKPTRSNKPEYEKRTGKQKTGLHPVAAAA